MLLVDDGWPGGGTDTTAGNFGWDTNTFSCLDCFSSLLIVTSFPYFLSWLGADEEVLLVASFFGLDPLKVGLLCDTLTSLS
jgi:hypothetical protein